jgi:pyruvate dehydrogenase E2 component (dihydrolipoamide acetyltransferase)
MPIHVLMHALSPAMTEGNLAKWHKRMGDRVELGDILADVETDKATMEVEAVAAGTLGQILVPEGSQGVKINQPIAILLSAGESLSDIVGQPVSIKAPADDRHGGVAIPRKEKQIAQSLRPIISAAAPRQAGERIMISPLARRLAQQGQLNISGIRGSGPGGRIVRADVLAALAESERHHDRSSTSANSGSFTVSKVSNMRRIIAARVSEAKRSVPHFYLTIDCRIEALLDLRRELNALPNASYKISVTDLIIRASAIALTKVPQANASWKDDEILQWNSVDIAVAVALDDGLITPIVRQANEKTVAQISTEMTRLAADARSGRLKPEEFQGGTFSISNLGMYGVRQFDAIINAPHAAILAVGIGERRPIVVGEQLVIGTVMTCTLSADHRIIDGALGAALLSEFKKLIEQPLGLIV